MRTVLVSLLLAFAASAAPKFVVHAHRGAMAVRLENTIASYQEAIRAGADYIEMDGAEQVRQYKCGMLNKKAFLRQKPVPGARIPTLDEVLELAKSSNINFNVEIKGSLNWNNYASPAGEFSRGVAAAVRPHKLDKRVPIQCFDFRVVKPVRAITPDLEAAALSDPGERTFVDIALEHDVRIVTPLLTLVTAEKIKVATAPGSELSRGPLTVLVSEID
jgi:glycerophosphoryl diester phosphodiesterase